MSKLTESEQFAYDWQYGRLGTFSKALANAIAHSDTVNRERLRKGFPEQVRGIDSFQKVNGWWEAVIAKMGEEQ